MDVRARCYGIAYDYLKRNLPSAESAIMLAPGIADAFAPTITKLVEALREFDKAHSNACAAFPATSEAQVLRDCDCRVKQAREALAELEKP